MMDKYISLRKYIRSTSRILLQMIPLAPYDRQTPSILKKGKSKSTSARAHVEEYSL
jgi:hypothetical protein